MFPLCIVFNPGFDCIKRDIYHLLKSLTVEEPVTSAILYVLLIDRVEQGKSRLLVLHEKIPNKTVT